MKLQELFSVEQVILSQPINEMAGLPSKNTGLPVFIWVGKVGSQHGPRIKVSNNKGKFTENDCFVISVGKPSEVITPRAVKLKNSDVELILDWATLNYEVLIEIYRTYETGDGDIVQLLSALKKI